MQNTCMNQDIERTTTLCIQIDKYESTTHTRITWIFAATISIVFELCMYIPVIRYGIQNSSNSWHLTPLLGALCVWFIFFIPIYMHTIQLYWLNTKIHACIPLFICVNDTIIVLLRFLLTFVLLGNNRWKYVS